MALSPTTSRAAATGGELDYVAITGDVAVSATTEAGANTVVTGSAVTYDGSTIVLIEFVAYSVSIAANAAGNAVVIVLYEDGTSIGPMGISAFSGASAGQASASLARRRTPSAGSHTYSIRAYRTNANSTIVAGAGGLGVTAPTFIRITRV